ncbi:hypothetical protein AB0N38_28865 [Micromonospora aurantiaca]|uniref:hypothetical protein n=1 Tax=Micromonospora TaxID=1873 RepID=UPI00182A85DF|nr:MULTISPECIES: hypothetical protein [Micromonospora]MDG4752808.1 hypothetical protein [Micromonospora sp. WMMD718]
MAAADEVTDHGDADGAGGGTVGDQGGNEDPEPGVAHHGTRRNASQGVVRSRHGAGCPGMRRPVFPGKRYEDWNLEDPAGKGVEAVRPIGDEIRTRVEKLLTGLGPTA